MDLVDTLENVGTEFYEHDEAAGLQVDKGVFKSAFASLYKVKSFSNQEKRREDMLVSIKTEMRFYWVKSKLEETPELQVQSEINPFVFYEINYFAAELPLIEEKLSRPFSISNKELPLDGILFYHRETSYLPIFKSSRWLVKALHDP
ncbi:hypothetical protein FQR65_LT08292 [Abscondita terminalis]|nr:hypothetical protein FQR65_LT08292 [Abscondita terminalis]